MTPPTVTNALLVVIAVLLAIMAWHLAFGRVMVSTEWGVCGLDQHDPCHVTIENP